MAVVLAKNLPRLRDYDAMEAPSARVGYQSNTTGENYARKSLARAQLKGYETSEAGIAALRAGEIDFFVHDAPTIWRLTGQFDPANDDLAGRYRPLTTEYLAWAVRKDEKALRDTLNGVLTRWEKDGVIDEILDRWIRVRKVTIEVAPPR
jgi:polar amino acid transport system substrate-binding protein